MEYPKISRRSFIAGGGILAAGLFLPEASRAEVTAQSCTPESYQDRLVRQLAAHGCYQAGVRFFATRTRMTEGGVYVTEPAKGDDFLISLAQKPEVRTIIRIGEDGVGLELVRVVRGNSVSYETRGGDAGVLC